MNGIALCNGVEGCDGIMHRVAIVGIGSYVPDNTVTNRDLEKKVSTSNEWIVTRTGIEERRQADEKTPTSKLAVEAARRALDSAGIKALSVQSE